MLRIAWIFAASAALLPACAGAARRTASEAAAPAVPAPPAAAAPTPAERLAQAELALGESRYAAAEESFRALIGGSVGAAAQRGLGRVLMLTGRQVDAQAALRAGAADLDTATLLSESLFQSGQSSAALQLLGTLKERPEARRARLLLGQILIERGRRSEAEPVLMTLIEDYNEDRIGSGDGPGLALVGRAAHLLRSPHDANDAFNAAERVTPVAQETLLWRGELFLEKHDPGHAEEVITEVLEHAPRQPQALVAMAHVKLEQALDFEAARALAEQALASSPGFGPAYFVLAGLALRDLDFTSALAAIEKGLESNREDLELLSLRAAVGFLSEDPALFESARRDVFQLNPSYSRFYSIVSEYAEWEHRYDRIVELMREAVSIDDDDAEAHAALGLNLIRAGQESAGVQSLRRAIAKDPFNVRVFNTLNLYEQVIPNDYVTRQRGRFSIRYPKAEADILDRYVPALLERAYAKFVKAYAFTPKEPIGIELYAAAEHFAVRTSGLPQTAILGVCFGKTLASMTPQAQSLNLGMTLWHELAHVFHIQMSESHVPRWLTEGLAEYETLLERREWRRHHDPELYLAWRARRLPQVSDMNHVFSHAESMQDMATAYYASSQISSLLVERYGRDRVNQLLRLYAKGPLAAEALPRALGGSASAVDAEFGSQLTRVLERYRSQFVPLDTRGTLGELTAQAAAAPRDVSAQLRLALGALEDKQLGLAERAWSDAKALDPNSADVRFFGARLSAAQGQGPAALAELRALAKDGHDGYAVQMAIAALTDADAQPDDVEAALTKAHEFDPTQAEPLQGLWRAAQAAGDEAAEVRILSQLAPLEERDISIYQRLLELRLAQRSVAEALQVGEAALYVDLEGARTHVLYARALALAGRFGDALFEFESAILCPSPAPELAAAHLAFADFLDSRGRAARAGTERARARELDPDAGRPQPAAPPP